MLDLLRVAVAAGLPPRPRARARSGAATPGRSAASCARRRASAALGVPRAQALARLARRCPLEGIAALVAASPRASATARRWRRRSPPRPPRRARASARSARERAARAAPKIQLVVALLLVPAVLLLVAAASRRAAGRMTREPTRQVCTIGATMTAGGRATEQDASGGRERILETAYELFSRHGTKAVGVDRIIAESGWRR